MATAKKTSKYFEAIGRRKTAVARVRLWPEAKAGFLVNEQTIDQYFKTAEQKLIAKRPLALVKLADRFAVSGRLSGGGLQAQAEALSHGIARALLKFDETTRAPLKQAKFLKRDPRMKERRKFGLKKARKSPQWSKR